MPFTKKTLKSIEACQEAIEFCERNRLFCNTPIKNLEIEGKYKRWAKWLNNRRELDYEYDTFGNLVKITYIDGWIETYMYEYDAAENITRIIYPESMVEIRDYDTMGRPTRIIRPNGIVETHVYDTAGNLTRTSYSNGETETYEYDIAGNLKRITYPNGETETHKYDTVGNLTKVECSYGLIETYNYCKTKTEFTMEQRGRMLLHIYNPEGWA